MYHMRERVTKQKGIFRIVMVLENAILKTHFSLAKSTLFYTNIIMPKNSLALRSSNTFSREKKTWKNDGKGRDQDKCFSGQQIKSS